MTIIKILSNVISPGASKLSATNLDGWLGVLRHFKYANTGYIMPEIVSVSKANGMYKRNYSFSMNITKKIL